MMANKNFFRKAARRSLALVMTLAMIFGMIQINAFASTYEDQTMEGWYLVDENNTVTGTTETGTHSEHGFELSKTIQQTGENQFDITLKVITSETVTTSDAAIQIVVDMSNSMDYCAQCGSSRDCNCNAGTRMDAVKEAIAGEGGFLDSLVANNGGKLFVSVIWFGTYAGVTCDWTDISNATGLNSVKSAVNGMRLPGGNDGGTNLDAGLMLARNRLDMEAIASASSKYTVLLTDGQPTYRTKEDSTSTSQIRSATSDDNGSAASDAEIDQAIGSADEVKALSKLYTICYGVSSEGIYESDTCAHCGKTHAEHEEVQQKVGKKYKTYYYCTDDEGNRLETVFEATSVTIGQFLANEIATPVADSVTYAFDADDTDQVNLAFADIAQSASAGMSGMGTTVTDPMGQYIVLGDVAALAAEGVTAETGTITWALDPANATKEVNGNVTTYIYEITYPITLDTSAPGFEAGKYYPTNGYTCLNVIVNGTEEQIPFPVPGVCGKLPQLMWKIEYYLQDTAAAGDYANYDLADSADLGPVDLWSTVNAPAGYADKFADQFYAFAAGEVQMQITETGENVMRLYYDRVTASVTVNHFYKADIIDAEGNEVLGTYPADPQITSTTTAFAGDTFTAVAQNTFGGYTYTLDTVDPALEITVAKGDGNVINLYYTRSEDQRVVTSAKVEHIYNSYSYHLVDGVWVLQLDSSFTETAEQAASVKATTRFNVSDAALPGYESYTLNTEKGDYADLLQADGTLSFIISSNAADNTRTLVFEKTTDDRQAASVTVNHYYTKSVTSIVDGQVVTVVEPDGTLGASSTYPIYVGEKFVAAELNSYLGDTYISDAGNAAKLTVDAVTGDTVIDLYYSLTLVPNTGSIIVNHYWRTFTEVTVEVTEEQIDPETGDPIIVVVGTKTEIRETLDHSIEDILIDNLYLGYHYTAAKESWGEGYTFNAAESTTEGIVGETAELNLYYDRTADADERSDADIDVLHVYTTYLTTIVDGKVTVVTLNDGSVSEGPFTGKAGDPFTATAAPAYNGNEYTQITADAALTTVLQPGTNATIVINYEREASDLLETAYEVNYEYRTYVMTVENGVAGYWDAPMVENGEPVNGTGYVGEHITIANGAKDGFAPLSTNPATAQTLADGGNSWTFVYEKYIPLDKGTVIVNHHYQTITINIDGTGSESEFSVWGTPVTKYLGETVLAEANLNGFQLIMSKVDDSATAEPQMTVTVTVTGETIVDFYYTKTIDNSVIAPWSITHIYNLYTWDGQLISSSASDPTTGTGFATTTLKANPEPNGYYLVGATYNGEELAEPYTISLQPEANDIVFTYELFQTRELLDVKVIHRYYQDEASMAGEPLSVYERTVTEVPEESEHTAVLRLIDGYKFHSADPADRTITVTKGGENVIILNYVRQTAEYQVIHQYFTNDELDGIVESELFQGFVGDTITADSIARQETYAGLNYTFQSITEDITLVDGEVKTITLTYHRVAYIHIPRPDIIIMKDADAETVTVGDTFHYTLQVLSVGDADAENVKVTDTLPAQVELIIEENAEYTYDPDTRTITWFIGHMAAGEGRQLTFAVTAVEAGTVTNVAIATGHFTRDEDDVTTEIEEPEQPPVDPPVEPPIDPPSEPDPHSGDEDIEDIEDPEVPLADVPETGEKMIYRVMVMVSAIVLLALVVTGRKKEEQF